MAAQFDAMGNYLGDYETEEERKKREELANTAVHTQEIKTYGDGTQEKITKEEIPGAIQPRTVMTAAGPVSPDTFARMQQAESGGRDYTAAGTPVTSPKGAMFANQVMPATAAQPGFGVRPAQSQTPEEYNRVGQEYYQALLKHFGGDEQKAVAAYNAGPGRVQQNITQNQGQLNVAQLPQETQGYLDKVLGGVGKAVNAVIPSAQAGTLTEAQRNAPATITPVAPGALPQVAQAPQAAPAPAAAPDVNAMFESAGKDPFKWMALAQDKNLPSATQLAAKQHAHELLTQEFNMSKAKEQATTAIAAAAQGDPKASRAIADELKNQEGSWVKMILLGFLSPQLAGEEAVKLGFGNKWVSATDDKGNNALIQVNAKGLPIKGIGANDKPLSEEEVARFAAGGVGALKAAEMPSVHGTPVVNAQGEGGMRMYDPRTRQAYVQVGRERRPDVGWTTTGQAPGATFNAAAAKAQGTAAGEGLVPTPVPAMPGVPGTGTPGMTPQAGTPAMPQVAPGAVAGPAVPGTPAVTGAMPVSQATAPVQAPVIPGAPQPSGTIAQQRLGIEAQKGQQQAYTKYVAEDVQPKADAGAQISRIRKDQINGPDGILNNPELAGLMQGTGGKGAEIANIVRDLITGNFKDQADLSQRVAALDLTPRQKDVLYKQIGLNAQINPLTLKANAGPGAVSEAEHKINAQANVDITRQPLYSGLTLMTRDQFEKDLQVARNDFRSANPGISTTDQLNRAWDAEKRKAQQAYDQIYAARAAYISKYNPDGKNAGAVVDAFKHYPVPEWTGTGWDYKTDFARKAARPALSNFNR